MPLNLRDSMGAPSRGCAHEEGRGADVGHAVRSGEERIGSPEGEARAEKMSVLDHSSLVGEKRVRGLGSRRGDQQTSSRQRIDVASDNDTIANSLEVAHPAPMKSCFQLGKVGSL